MTVTCNAYNELKRDFFRKHHNDFKVDTGMLNEYDGWNKTYIFLDGAIWYEVYTKVVETVEAEAHYCKVRMDVSFLKTEFWSSDDARSRYYYERY